MVSQTLEMKPSRLTLIVLSVATLAAGQTCDNFVRCVLYSFLELIYNYTYTVPQIIIILLFCSFAQNRSYYWATVINLLPLLFKKSNHERIAQAAHDKRVTVSELHLISLERATSVRWFEQIALKKIAICSKKHIFCMFRQIFTVFPFPPFLCPWANCSRRSLLSCSIFKKCQNFLVLNYLFGNCFF